MASNNTAVTHRRPAGRAEDTGGGSGRLARVNVDRERAPVRSAHVPGENSRPRSPSSIPSFGPPSRAAGTGGFSAPLTPGAATRLALVSIVRTGDESGVRCAPVAGLRCLGDDRRPREAPARRPRHLQPGASRPAEPGPGRPNHMSVVDTRDAKAMNSDPAAIIWSNSITIFSCRKEAPRIPA